MSYKGGQYLPFFFSWLGWYWSSLPSEGLCIFAAVIAFSLLFAALTFNLAGSKELGSSNNKKVRSCFPFHLSLLWSPGRFSLCTSVLLGDGRLCQVSVCLAPPHPSSSRWNLPDSSAALLNPHRRYRQIKCHHGFVLHALPVGLMHCRAENVVTRTRSETWCGSEGNPYLILKSDN